MARLIELARGYLDLNVDIVTIEKLDKLYIDSRYPGDLGLLPDGKPTIKDSEEFYRLAKSVHETVKSNLSGEAKTNNQ